MSLIGRKVLQYEIRGLLGAGGMGEVYEAYDAVLDKRVAVRVLHPHLAAKSDQAARFVGEAIAASNVRTGANRLHENVVEVVGRDVIDGRAVIVLEYLEGADLEAWLQSRERGGHGPVAVDDVARILLQICYALDAAHRSEIVHRDLKPPNVFVVSNAARRLFVKLLDFGIAKIGSHLHATGVYTAGPMGTLQYMAPEQAEAPRTVDARADIWAVGCILYRVLTGRQAYELEEGDNWGVGLRARQAEGHRPPPPSSLRRDLDPRWDAIVARCFAYDRENRYPDVQMLAEHVVEVAGDDGPEVFAEVWSGGFTRGPDGFTRRNVGGVIPPPSKPSFPAARPAPTSVSGAAGAIEGGTMYMRAPRWARIAAPLVVVGALVIAVLLVVRGRTESRGADGGHGAAGSAVVPDGGSGATFTPSAADAAPIVDTVPVVDAGAAMTLDSGIARPAVDDGAAKRRSSSRGKPPPARTASPVDAGVRSLPPDAAPPRRRFDPDGVITRP